MTIRALFAGQLEAITSLDSDRVERGSSLTHEVWLGSIVNPASLRDLRVTCHIRATPKGWATLGGPSDLGAEEKVVRRIPDWTLPREGRKGLHSRYLAVAHVTTTTVHITRDPPSRHGARQQAEIQTAFPIGGELASLLHDLFWIEL